MGSHSLLQGILEADSLPSEPPGKPGAQSCFPSKCSGGLPKQTQSMLGPALLPWRPRASWRQEPPHSASQWAAAPSPQAALLRPSTHCASGQVGVTLRRHQLPGHPIGHELAGGAGGRLNPQRLPLQTVISVNGPINCLYVATVVSAASMPRSIEGWRTMLVEWPSTSSDSAAF